VLPATDEKRHWHQRKRPHGQGGRTGDGRRTSRFRSADFRSYSQLLDQVKDLTLLAMVGIVDPPRPEARDAIARCHSAGIQVRMITGDHAVTAAAIGHELGIEGKALTGAEFAAMSDDQLMKDLPEIGVVARVAPEDKIRLVDLLQRQQNIVAMTGDGVNDAPALKKADIGVAMGITGTEVSKGAAVMILTDDNFATIVKAVEFGRGIYENLSNFIRFQMTNLVAYITAYLGAAFFFIAGGVPFAPFVVLWINFCIQVPVAISLGFDEPSPGLMDRKPRPINQPVLSRSQWVRIGFIGVLIAAGTLFVESGAGPLGAAVAATMAFVVFSLFVVSNGISCHSETLSAFPIRNFLHDRHQVMLYGLALLLIILPTELDFPAARPGPDFTERQPVAALHRLAIALLIVNEIIKVFLRSRRNTMRQLLPSQSQPRYKRLGGRACSWLCRSRGTDKPDVWGSPPNHHLVEGDGYHLNDPLIGFSPDLPRFLAGSILRVLAPGRRQGGFIWVIAVSRQQRQAVRERSTRKPSRGAVATCQRG